MKKIYRWLLFMFTLFCSVSSFSQSGDLRIKQKVIDIGILKEGEIAKIDFEIENPSPISYKIYSVTSTCGCTVPKYPKQIGAKGKVIISATFDSKGFQGNVKKELVLVTNDKVKYYKMQFLVKVTK